MKNQVAVVFDSAGTLLHMYRVAKDGSTGMILENVQSTLLVARKPHRALVVINANLEEVSYCDPQLTLHNLIEEYDIKLDVSCASRPFGLDEVYGIIRTSNVCVSDLNDVVSIVRGHCPDTFYLAAGIIVDAEENVVPYVLSTGGRMYSDTPVTIKLLQDMGADIFIASGDGYENLEKLALSVDIPISYVHGVANTRDKERIVRELQETYDLVVMVGDGMNDILALKAADVGILTVQQGDERPQVLWEAADVIVNNILEVTAVIENLSNS
ncbi:HAD family hydrolase [Methanolobus sp. ZRKC2]|uniref:HAD family hydrolase n=1 Tax=Methanolobus sp. ZRKC2 TaxID=3125783 RepID=UPI00324FF9BB